MNADIAIISFLFGLLLFALGYAIGKIEGQMNITKLKQNQLADIYCNARYIKDMTNEVYNEVVKNRVAMQEIRKDTDNQNK